jgi:hypothetical protein
MTGKRPARRPDGRPGPRKGYPQNPELYADPSNWKYPVHTPTHARRAQQYFSRPANRAKYSPNERDFVEARIAAALQRFGLAAEFGLAQERLPAPPTERLSAMTLTELLAYAAGRSRFERARDKTPPANFRARGPSRWRGTVASYQFVINVSARSVTHDCPDFRRQAPRGMLCKHICRLFLDLPEPKAASLLRRILSEDWDLTAG